MPSPTPTDEDVDFVREVAGENSNTAIALLVDNLNDAQWQRALDLITAWNEIAPGSLVALEGGREAVKLSDQEGLDDLRKRMRLLLGLPELRDASLIGGPGTTWVPNVWVF
jgi:hypothetical protein